MKVGLVLGGGGISGFAYTTTALTVLQQLTGWDPRTADVIVGTSAGANVGGLLRGGRPIGDSLDQMMTLPTNPRTMERLRVLSGRELNGRNFSVLPASPSLLIKEGLRGPLARPGRLISGLFPAGRVRTDTIGDRMIELHGQDWPEQELFISAVRLTDGERVIFGRDRTDIDVGTAVEASSAIPGYFRPVGIDGFQYVDGGVHSAINADVLAERELDLIVVVAPMSIVSYSRGWMMPNGALRLFWKNQVEREVESLRELGHNVMLLEPSIEEARSMGPTLMDPTRLINIVMQTSSAARVAMTHEDLDPQFRILRKAAA